MLSFTISLNSWHHAFRVIGWLWFKISFLWSRKCENVNKNRCVILSKSFHVLKSIVLIFL